MLDKIKSFFSNVSITTIVGAVLIVVGAVLGYFAGGGTSIVAFAVAMFGAGTAIADYFKEHSSCNKALTIATMVLMGAGALIAGITGAFSESDVTNLIGYITSAVALIASLVCGLFNCKKSETSES